MTAQCALAVDAMHVFDDVSHECVDNEGVSIHCATLGTGDPLVFVHGFPDFWGSWYRQMHALAGARRTVAMDQRGYNLSDRPAADQDYAVPRLVSDVAAVIKAFGESAILVGHDWGGAVAWTTAMTYPELVERLVIFNAPHPHGLARALATDPVQRKNSAYARRFQADPVPDLTPEKLLAYLPPQTAYEQYLDAFSRSDIAALMRYYRVNYPQVPYTVQSIMARPVSCPVLVIHGLDDSALQPSGLNDTWRWIDAEMTLVTMPGAGHWVHHECADDVNRIMTDWLSRTRSGGI